MDYDRLALFLASCTSRGFRWSLWAPPHETLRMCGFDALDAAELARSLGKHGKRGFNEYEEIQFAFQKNNGLQREREKVGY